MSNKFESQVKGFFDAKLPFEILESFTPLEESEVLDKGACISYVDNNILKIDLKEKIGSIVSSIISAIIVIFIFSFDLKAADGAYNFLLLTLLLLSITSFLFFFIKIFSTKRSLIILDRKNGIFSFPYRLQRYKLYKTEFNRAIVYWQGSGGVTGNLGISLIAQHPDKKVGGADLVAHVSGFRKIWSFYVWYMDKNRPLPPGTAFDPYRQADFERRKSEGFPKPLYRSHIPTPEATPAQQLERERYWKDELEEFTREPESEMYDPQVHKGWVSARWLSDDDSPTSNTYFKFEFDNGEIIYIKTDESGLGHKPSNDQKFTMTRMDLFESWF